MKIEATIQEDDNSAPSPRSGGWRIELGKLGERKAIEYLQQLGWHVIAVNWRCGRFGEIDIVARDASKMLVFCVVKTRMLTSEENGFRNEGFESITCAPSTPLRKLVDLTLSQLNIKKLTT